MTSQYRLTPHVSRKVQREKTAISDGSSDVSKESVRVFCRLRPLKDDEGDESCITLVSPTVLSLNSPSDYKLSPHRELHCQFKQIFTSYATQKEVFEFVALPLLQDLFKGKNALLLSYGVTGSGKTYTLSGEPNNPGIMPRSIDTIFNTIDELQAPKFTIKPDKMNGFSIQSEDEAARERLLENKLSFKHKTGRKLCGYNPQYINDGTKISDVDESCSYAVFVSYVEIYNNTAFDLLEETNNKSLQPKILREDAQKNMYIFGVNEVEVKSAEEAFELLSIGQRKKKMGHTLLNSESSRSHSVFNIRLVQIEQVAHNSNGDAVVPDTNLIRVSQLSLVDLAGSERTNRTQTTGMRLKEAGRINNSLMCLRNCLEVLRENQQSGGNKLVPYRDSRLTLLFKNYFEGYGKVEMIVCVNPSSKDYEENLQVMKFAEMTQDVKIKEKEYRGTPIPRKTPRKIFTNTPSTVSKGNAAFTLPKIPKFIFNPENVNEMEDTLDQIGKVLKLRSTRMEGYFKEWEDKEMHLRKRLCTLNENHILTVSEMKSLRAVNKKSEEKICNYNSKITELETVNDSLAAKNEELQNAIRSLKRTIDEKDLKINQKILEKEKVKEKFVKVNEKMSQELDNKLRKQREHLQASMKAKEEKLKRVREILESDEAAEAVSKQTEKERESPKSPSPESQPVTSPPFCDAHTSSRRNVQTPGRHRRSRSAGEVWLEHNSIKPVPLGTVLQPSMKKRKSLSKLTKASDITNPNQSKYCLIAQEQDTEGEIETKVYKGDIVSTCGGGAQVIFNDVELLRQKSPTATP